MFNPQPKPEKKERRQLTNWEFRAKYFRSNKRKIQEREYLATRREWLKDKPCARCFDNGVKRAATEVHHMKGRIGGLLNKIKYWIALCRDCHTWVENNPTEAIERGYSIKRLGK